MIDYNHFSPQKHKPIKDYGGPTYLYFGEPLIKSELEDLIMACEIVTAAIPKAKLMFIENDKQERQKITDMVNLWGLGNHVIIKELVSYSELPGYILGATCVVVPSMRDGFNAACVVACAMGVPVVANKTKSLSSLVSGKFRLSAIDYYNRYTPLANNIMYALNGKYTETPIKKFNSDDEYER